MGSVAGEKSLRVLVVDDHAVQCQVLTRQLGKLGYAARSAGGGGEALALLARESFDAVLMDCQMPDLDGYETTRRIRERETEAGEERMVVIAITAHAGRVERQKCRDVGMDKVMTKPIGLAELENILERWLGRGRKARRRDDDFGPGSEDSTVVAATAPMPGTADAMALFAAGGDDDDTDTAVVKRPRRR